MPDAIRYADGKPAEARTLKECGISGRGSPSKLASFELAALVAAKLHEPGYLDEWAPKARILAFKR